MHAFNRQLIADGELVDAQGLAMPSEARVVRARADGSPAVTDGPFAEAKEFLAGYWIVDVESPERRYEIAARASAAPGQGRRADEHADRGAPGDERARPGRVTERDDLRQGYGGQRLSATPSSCCASWRRRCSAPSCGATATSPPPRTRCRKR